MKGNGFGLCDLFRLTIQIQHITKKYLPNLHFLDIQFSSNERLLSPESPFRAVSCSIEHGNKR